MRLRKLILALIVGLCLIAAFMWVDLQREVVRPKTAPSLNTIITRTIRANRFWLTLPYESVSYSYKFVSKGGYVAQVFFKAPDKTRLKEVRNRWHVPMTIIFNAGQFAVVRGGVAKRVKQAGLDIGFLTPAKTGLQLFPPSHLFITNPTALSIRLLGGQRIMGRNVWVLDVKGKTRGHIGVGCGTHFTFGGISFGADMIRLFVDSQTFALLREEVYANGRLFIVLNYAEHQRLGKVFVPTIIQWEKVWRPSGRWFDDLLARVARPVFVYEMQIVDRKVWLLRRATQRIWAFRIKLAEVTDVKVKPLPDRLFELPASHGSGGR